MDWRAAIPTVERAMERGIISGWYVTAAEIESWRGGETVASRDRLPADPLERFAPRHRAALASYRRRLDEATSLDVKERVEAFSLDLASLMPTTTPREGPRLGRNDPCHCGSGKNYKKCHLEADEVRPDPIRFRIARLDKWPPMGYALTVSQQLQQMPRAEVEAHVDILAMSPAQLRQRLADEDNDYLLWAGAQRWRVLGNWERAVDLATRVAASNACHPALDYRHIERLAVLPPEDGRAPRSGRDMWFHHCLRTGELSLAWDIAEDVLVDDLERGLAMFRQALDAHPGNLWTAAALADAAADAGSPEVVDELEIAVARAREGGSRPHPELPDEPCPVDVLEAFLEDARAGQRERDRLRAVFARLDEDPLKTPARVFVNTWRSETAAASRSLRLALEDATTSAEREAALSRHDEQVRALAAKGSEVAAEVLSGGQVERAKCRAVVLASVERRDGTHRRLLCVAAPPQVDLVRAALAQLAAEVSSEPAGPASGSWGPFTAVLLDVATDEEGLHDLLQILVDEAQGDAASSQRLVVVPFERAHLDAVAAPADWTSLIERPVAAAPAPAPEPELELTHADYLRRILQRMVRMGKIGAAHTDLGHFLRGVPKSARGAMKDLLDAMILDRYVRVKPTVTSPHISLEPVPLRDVLDFIDGGAAPGGRARSLLAEG